MTVRAIVKYPSPALKAVAEPVTLFDAALKELAADLVDTMQAAQGIGITAPHIGVAQRVAVIKLTEDEEPKVYVNPKIVWASEEMTRHKEGSISMPDVLDEIDRPNRIRFSFQDLSGAEQMEEAEDLASVCIQHEIDQLDGIFWLDKLSRLRRDRVIKRYEKLLRLA